MASFIIPFTSIFWRKKQSKLGKKGLYLGSVVLCIFVNPPTYMQDRAFSCHKNTHWKIPSPDLHSNAPPQTWTGVLKLHDRRKATAAHYSQRVHPRWVFEHGGLLHSACPQAVVKMEERAGAKQDEYARTSLSWGRNKETISLMVWASAQRDTAGICVSGFQSSWKSRQSAPEFLLVPVTTANPELKWSDEKNTRERKCAGLCVYAWPSTKVPWTRPKDMTSVQNNAE